MIRSVVIRSLMIHARRRWVVIVTMAMSYRCGQTVEREAKRLVRKGGLEPPRCYPPDPKSGASANSATFACVAQTRG